MTQPTRMLIVLGVFSVAAAVALSVMAQRYVRLLQRPDAPASPPPPAAEAASPAGAGPSGVAARELALRHVDAFIAVRRALARADDDPGAGGAPGDGPRLADPERALERALVSAGMDRATYERILEMHRAWKSGRADVSGPLPDAFELRRQDLERLD